MVFTADYNCYVSFNDTNWRKVLFFNFIETIGLWNIILTPFKMEIRKKTKDIIQLVSTYETWSERENGPTFM